MTPFLDIRNIDKSFFGIPVLKDVSVRIGAGRVLGLVGGNGAGKSTLMNVLAGVVSPDRGAMRLGGETYAPRSPLEAARAGVALIHQELNLFDNLTVAENVFLVDTPRRPHQRFGWIDRHAVLARTRELLEAVDLRFAPDTMVADLSPGERQLVEIAKGLRTGAKVLVFDEPTTSLSRPEADRLFGIIGRLRGEGRSIVFISHNLDDVLRICDEVAVLRDGRLVAAGATAEFTTRRLVSLMAGRDVEQLFPKRPKTAGERRVMLEVQHLSRPGVVEDVSFALHRGEILGLSGLMGSGRTELARLLFGLDSYRSGTIRLRGRPFRPTPRRCARGGMAFLTEDRRREGLLADATVADNLALASLGECTLRPTGWIRAGRLRRRVEKTAQRVGLVCRSIDRQPVKTLSGGNQQKVVVGKWLSMRPDVLIVDEPTRGVDVAAKQELYRLIAGLAAGGAAILFISSETEELTGLCDRILVMHRGRIVSEVDRTRFDGESLLASAFGTS